MIHAAMVPKFHIFSSHLYFTIRYLIFFEDIISNHLACCCEKIIATNEALFLSENFPNYMTNSVHI